MFKKSTSFLAAISVISLALTACSGGAGGQGPLPSAPGASTPMSGPPAVAGDAAAPESAAASEQAAAPERLAMPVIAHSFMRPNASVVTVSPKSLGIIAIGVGSALQVTVAQTGFTGSFAIAGCTGVAKASAVKGPSNKSTVQGLKAGSCSLTFTGTGGQKATLPITVTTTSLKLTGPLPSAATATVKIAQGSKVVGTPVVTLTACSNGCTIAVPAPVGNDTFTVNISDAGKHTLAVGNPNTVQVQAGKNTPGPPIISFLKVIGSLTWGSLPAASAGTAIGNKAVTVTAKDADGNVISGSYQHPISIGDGDTSGATTFQINAGSASNGLTKSTDALTLSYSGLAIVPATFQASSIGVTAAKAIFTPVLAGVVYTGPTSAPNNPEIDLYSNVPASSGFSGNFTATQTGWTNSPYNKAFVKYAFTAINGQTNNCPGATNPAYAVTPAIGAVGTAFTVSASTQLQGASDTSGYAGECLMTITGGAGQTKAVVLTYTSSSVGVGLRHRKHKP